jgi:hypothetical protein
MNQHNPTTTKMKLGSTQARVATEMTSVEKNGRSPRKVVGKSLKVAERGGARGRCDMLELAGGCCVDGVCAVDEATRKALMLMC